MSRRHFGMGEAEALRKPAFDLWLRQGCGITPGWWQERDPGTWKAASCDNQAQLTKARADIRNVEVDDLVRHVLHAESFRDALLQQGRALEKWLRAGEEGPQLAGKRADVSGRNERHVDARDDFWNAA